MRWFFTKANDRPMHLLFFRLFLNGFTYWHWIILFFLTMSTVPTFKNSDTPCKNEDSFVLACFVIIFISPINKWVHEEISAKFKKFSKLGPWDNKLAKYVTTTTKEKEKGRKEMLWVLKVLQNNWDNTSIPGLVLKVMDLWSTRTHALINSL